MAKDTPITLKNAVLYEIYVRNHGPQGTFAEVQADLERIRSLGVDILWFMPIHPIGKLNKKGALGCPYSIADYREVNPEYGTREDFSTLLSHAHQMGLKVMIDVVFNHTAHDSVLVSQHPDWFHQDEEGRPITTVPEWSDVIDLKHPNRALSASLIETLQHWAAFGVDGFRCDVASLLPLSFWKAARIAVAEVKPGMIWLAESVHASFVESRRRQGLTALSDGELYRAFDLTYDYDIWPIWQAAVRGKVATRRYLEMLRFQSAIYPENFIKMRCVENHDQPRILQFAPSPSQALAWSAFSAFTPGAFLIYAGQEAGAVHRPSLFDVDKVEWRNYPQQDFLTVLAQLKKHPAQINGQFTLINDGEPAIEAMWYAPEASLWGIFNVSHQPGETRVSLEDGSYSELLSGQSLGVKNGRITLPESAAIVEGPLPRPGEQFFAPLLDMHYEF